MTATEDTVTTNDPPTAQARTTDPAASGLTRWKVIADWLLSHKGLIALLLLPLVVFGIPELFGWVFLDGDNFLQNLPMRVLVGRDLQHWSLPLWNPYLFGGTPLLGGFNAGAAYPVTWLTAILPTFTAWTLNLALAYDLAVGGMYLFLRRQSISNTGALFGAAGFAFAGYMSGQIVHIDLIEGAAWMPWTLVAVHGLTNGPSPTSSNSGRTDRATRGWVALLVVSLGLSLLTGSAEAIIDSSVLVAIYAIGRLITMGYFEKIKQKRTRDDAARPLLRCGRRSRPWGGAVAAGSAIPLGVSTFGFDLHLLHQWIPAGSTGGAALLPVCDGHRPGPSGPVHRALQFPRGDRLRRCLH